MKPVGTLRHAAMPCLEAKIPLVVRRVLMPPMYQREGKDTELRQAVAALYQ